MQNNESEALCVCGDPAGIHKDGKQCVKVRPGRGMCGCEEFKPIDIRELLSVFRYIEELVSDELSMDFEMSCRVHKEPVVLKPEDIQLIERKLASIYRAVHSFTPNHICYKVHEDWRRETRGSLRRMFLGSPR